MCNFGKSKYKVCKCIVGIRYNVFKYTCIYNEYTALGLMKDGGSEGLTERECAV